MEHQAALLSNAARKILEADHPLSLEEIFPDNGRAYGKKFSRTLLRNIIQRLVQNSVATERKGGSVVRYELRDRARLEELAAVCPPDVQEEEQPMGRVRAYNAKEWERYARISVATRALKRLVAADKSTSTSQFQPRTTLFIAQKGDKYQEKQVWDKRWQDAFLKKLEKLGALTSNADHNLAVYCIANQKLVQDIIENKNTPCIHDLLWPDEPCTIDHTQIAEDAAQALGLESDTELEDEEADEEEESEPEPAPEPEVPVVKETVVELPKLEKTAPKVIKTTKEDEDISSKGALGTVCELITSLSENVLVLSKAASTTNSLLVKMNGEVDHLHSKMDKLHEENVQLRKEQDKMKAVLTDVGAAADELLKMLDPEDSSINAVRKRLGDIEKLAASHKELLEGNSKLIKTGLAEAANAMVTEAAKVFIKEDHTEVLTKIAAVEENVIDTTSKTTKVLEKVYEALEKVRAEYKNTNRMPIILERMSTIAEELQNLQGLLPENASRPVKTRD